MMAGLGFGGMMFGGLMMLAFWILVIVGVVWFVAALARGGAAGAQQLTASANGTGQTALDALKVRYAKGDISKEQFEEMRRDLGV